MIDISGDYKKMEEEERLNNYKEIEEKTIIGEYEEGKRERKYNINTY